MEDLDLMMILDDLCANAEGDPAQMPAIADIIFLIRDEEDKAFDEVLAKFDGDLVGRLAPLCEKGLITKKFLKGKMRYSITPSGKAYLAKELS